MSIYADKDYVDSITALWERLRITDKDIKMSIYTDKGYTDRAEYLLYLSENYGVRYNIVETIANLYGPAEDFDGLITALEDYQQEH